MKVFVLSDTHGYIDDQILSYAEGADEVWHVGDWGHLDVYHKLSQVARVRGVYGNIDGQQIRLAVPKINRFEAEGQKIFMIHIGGYPGRYKPEVRTLLQKEKPDAVLVGHSHILKVMFDKKLQHLHLNPGAAGKHGFHQVRTALQLDVTPAGFSNLKVIEWPK
jgi:putative phosphoesterase